MPVTTASPRLIPFVCRHEGRVHEAYRDAGGVVTIGLGFTGLSTVFSRWWRAHRGRGLRLGDTISDAECDLLLGLLLTEEYAPPVAKRFGGGAIRQNEFDAATDLCFNCGPGALQWSWAGLLAARAVAAAAARLRATAVTAGGRRLKGLERRRADEARLMETGDYGSGTAFVAGDDVKAYQAQLAALGLYAGAIDGVAGAATLAAVRAFQDAQGLIVDGVVGPASRAALARAIEAKKAPGAIIRSAGGGAAGGGGLDAVQHGAQVDWHLMISMLGWGAAIATVALIAFLLWRYRGVILRRRIPA